MGERMKKGVVKLYWRNINFTLNLQKFYIIFTFLNLSTARRF